MCSSFSGESQKDRSKKKYSKFSQEELEQINKLFSENGFYPDVNEVREFAKSSGIKVIKLENWFKYNRRKMAYHGNLMSYRKRRVFRHQDLDFLRTFFEDKPYPKSSQYKEIAKKVNAPLQQVINWFANQRKKYSKNKGSFSKGDHSNERSYNNEETNSSMIKVEENDSQMASLSFRPSKEALDEDLQKNPKAYPLENSGLSTKSKRIFKEKAKMNPSLGDYKVRSPCENMKEMTRENIKTLASMSQSALAWQRSGAYDPTYLQKIAAQSQYQLEGEFSNNPDGSSYAKGSLDCQSQARRDAFMKMVNMQKKLNYFNSMMNAKQARDYFLMQMKYTEMRDLQGRANGYPYYYQNYVGNAAPYWVTNNSFNNLPNQNALPQNTKIPYSGAGAELFQQNQPFSFNSLPNLANYCNEPSQNLKSFQNFNYQQIKAKLEDF